MIKIHPAPKRKPDWLKIKLKTTENYNDMKSLMDTYKLNTVCEEAKCPNIYECWDNRTATVDIGRCLYSSMWLLFCENW